MYHCLLYFTPTTLFILTLGGNLLSPQLLIYWFIPLPAYHFLPRLGPSIYFQRSSTRVGSCLLNHGRGFSFYSPPQLHFFSHSNNFTATHIRLTTLSHNVTSRDVNEARGGLIRATGRVRSKKKKLKTKNRENPPHPKHTTKATAARRPRPARDGTRGNTSHALAHTRPPS